MTPRLHLPAPLIEGVTVEVSADDGHYLLQVLRLRVGDEIEVFDGEGARHAATLAAARRQQASVSIGVALPALDDGPLRLTLIQGLSAADKMDWTIEKATELGVARIVPLMTQRGKVRLDAERAARRHAHWQRLIVAACRQCGRDRLPELAPVATWATLTEAVIGAGSMETSAPSSTAVTPETPTARWLLAPPVDGSAAPRLSARARAFGGSGSIALLAGPESGFDDAEVAMAMASGFLPTSLGPRVLRTETAGLSALAALQALCGDG